MDKLQNILQMVLGNTFVMYFKAHTYHWNVEGPNFSQLHDFFGGLYTEVHGAVDVIAEEMRALDVYAPVSIMELYNTKTIKEDTEKPADAKAMLANLQEANEKVIDTLNKLFDAATKAGQQGLADFAAGRIDVHKKHGWMIRSYLK